MTTLHTDIYNFNRRTKLKIFFTKLLYQSIGAVMATFIFSYFTVDWLFFHINKPFWKVKKINKPAALNDPRLGQHRHAGINGLKYHFVEKGDKSKPLILFVHGFPEGWYSWRHQIERLSKHFWVIAPDLRGYGETAKPKGVHNYRMAHIVEDLKELVRDTGKTKVHLVGHDWGGYVSWCFLSIHPGLIESFVLINTGTTEALNKIYKIDWRQNFKSWYMIFFHLPYFPELYMRANDFRSLNKFGYSKNQDEDSFVNVFKYLFNERDAYTCPINFYRANLIANPIHKLFAPKERISEIPGMVLWGKDDIFLSEKIADLIAEELPYVQKYKLQGGHFIHQEQPEKINDYLYRFFNDQIIIPKKRKSDLDKKTS